MCIRDSTYGVQKRSGRLFKRFLQETGLTAKQLLFIGDSWRADVAGAALASITAWHLPTPPAPADDAAAFVENRLPQQRSDGESLGFSVLGPLAAAFCQWLHAHRAARPVFQYFSFSAMSVSAGIISSRQASTSVSARERL